MYITKLTCQNPNYSDSETPNYNGRAYYCFDNNTDGTHYDTSRTLSMYCITTDTSIYASSDTATCENGFFILIDEHGNYFDLDNARQRVFMKHYYKNDSGGCTTCNYGYNSYSNSWIYSGAQCTNNPGVWETHSNGGFTIIYDLDNL